MSLSSLLNIDVNALPSEDKVEMFKEGMEENIAAIVRLLVPHLNKRDSEETARDIAMLAIDEVMGLITVEGLRQLSPEELAYYVKCVGDLKLSVAKSPAMWVKWYYVRTVHAIARAKNACGRPRSMWGPRH